MLDEVVSQAASTVGEFAVGTAEDAAVRGEVEDGLGVGLDSGGAGKEEGRRELVNVRGRGGDVGVLRVVARDEMAQDALETGGRGRHCCGGVWCWLIDWVFEDQLGRRERRGLLVRGEIDQSMFRRHTRQALEKTQGHNTAVQKRWKERGRFRVGLTMAHNDIYSFSFFLLLFLFLFSQVHLEESGRVEIGFLEISRELEGWFVP